MHIVTSVHRTGYTVNIDGKPEFCIINNSFKGDERPVVGDFVTVERVGDQILITGIAPRRNYIGRYDHYKDKYQGFAANVDTIFVVTSANKEFSSHRLRRFLTLSGGQDIDKVVVLTKIDENKKGYGKYVKIIENEFPGVRIVAINALDKKQVEGLLEYTGEDSTVLLLGSSGVGKSTIINTLCGLVIKTKETQCERFANRGKHTTSSRNLYFSDYGIKIIDVPGVRIVGVESEVARASEIFDKIEELAFKCKYTNCRHLTEDRCMVKQAIADGNLTQAELDNYNRVVHGSER